MTALVDKFANQLDWNLLRTFMVIGRNAASRWPPTGCR